MSLYYDKIESVKNAIINDCKERIETNFGELDMWLSYEDWEFPHVYTTEFNKEFSQYISQDKDTETIIYYAGTNLTYFVSTITTVTMDLKKIKKLVEEFITRQLDDFNNTCDYISMTMYDEINPDTDETSGPVVQNTPENDNPN